MKIVKSTEKLIKDIYTNKMQVTTSSNLDKKVLANSMSTLDKVKSKKSTSPQPNIWSIVAKSKIAQIAAAAVIIIATSLFFVQRDQTGITEISQFSKKTELPAELTTIASLSFAYRQGGMDMVEKKCDRALQLVGQKPANISTQYVIE